MRHVLAIGVTGMALAVGGCGGGTKTVTTTATTTATDAAVEEAPTTPTTEAATPTSEIGKVRKSGGITLRVLNVRKASKLRLNGGTQTDATPSGEPRTIKAKQGGRYVFVKTRVTNKTSGGIDITCSFPIDAKLVDDAGREFDPIQDLYLIRGNPYCNDKVQPGFKTKMTWAFLVPPGTKAAAFRFADVESQAEPTDVALTP